MGAAQAVQADAPLSAVLTRAAKQRMGEYNASSSWTRHGRRHGTKQQSGDFNAQHLVNMT